MKSSSGQLVILAILTILVMGSFVLVGGFELPKSDFPQGEPVSGVMVIKPSETEKSNLQMSTFDFAQPPNQICYHDVPGQPAQIFNGKPVKNPTCECGIAYLIECQNNACVRVYPSKQAPDLPPEGVDCNGYVSGQLVKSEFDGWCRYYQAGGLDAAYCMGKPVIYLYPEKETLVDVSIQTSGNIVASDPHYNNGWRNVLASPDGTLLFQGKTYNELFYETNVEDFLKPMDGIIIPGSQIELQIKNFLFQLGLNETEAAEFLYFWVPKLKALNSNYILFSLIEKDVKDSIDHVNIQPEPDTRIELLVYFKPLEFPVAVKPLILPERPKRVGFTMVEWGGTIETNDGIF